MSPPCGAAGAHRSAAAVGRAHDHPVADRDAGDLVADPLHDPGHLVAERDRVPRDQAHVDVGHVGAADAAGGDADERVAGPGLGSGMSSRRQSFAPCSMTCFIGWVTSRGLDGLRGTGVVGCEAPARIARGAGPGALEHDAHELRDPGIVDAGHAAQGGVEDRAVDHRGEHRRVEVGSQLARGLRPVEPFGDEARRRAASAAALAPFGRATR